MNIHTELHTKIRSCMVAQACHAWVPWIVVCPCRAAVCVCSADSYAGLVYGVQLRCWLQVCDIHYIEHRTRPCTVLTKPGCWQCLALHVCAFISARPGIGVVLCFHGVVLGCVY